MKLLSIAVCALGLFSGFSYGQKGATVSGAVQGSPMLGANLLGLLSH